jgi:hypothetical protein
LPPRRGYAVTQLSCSRKLAQQLLDELERVPFVCRQAAQLLDAAAQLSKGGPAGSSPPSKSSTAQLATARHAGQALAWKRSVGQASRLVQRAEREAVAADGILALHAHVCVARGEPCRGAWRRAFSSGPISDCERAKEDRDGIQNLRLLLEELFERLTAAR